MFKTSEHSHLARVPLWVGLTLVKKDMLTTYQSSVPPNAPNTFI